MLSLLLLALQPAAPPIEIDIDRYGVPAIFARSDVDAAYALGYEQALNMGEQMAVSYKIARGRYAEVAGRSHLLTDGFIRALGIEDDAEAASQNPPGDPAEIDSFLAGANRGIAEARLQGHAPAWIAPFTRTDVFALMQFVNAAFPLLDFQASLSRGAGSNQFAIGPQRSATGHPILSMDPHLSIDGGDLILWFEFAQYTPQGSFRGVSIPGLPFGAMGHNDRVAWSMTNNDPALTTRYKVVTDPNDRSRYSYHGEWRPFKTKKLEMSYLDGGQLKTSTQTVRLTDWGPMIPLRNEALNCPVVGQFAALQPGASLQKATSVADFRRRLSKRGFSMWNFVFADVDGHIGYQYNAMLPSRKPDFPWRGAVPGDTADTRLGELVPYDDLPHVTDPKCGFLVNCNSSPWLTAPSGEIPSVWPNYVTTYGITSRYERLSRLLSGDGSVSVDRAKQFATDTLVPDGLASAKALIAAGADADAARVLRRWNGRAETGSVGPALFVYWLVQDKSSPVLAAAAGQGKPWTADQARSAIDSLKAAEAKLIKDHGRLDVHWGDVLYLMRGKKEAPSGGYGYLYGGVAAVRPTSGAWDPAKGRIHATFGSSMRMIVSLEPGHVRSWSVLPYGNSWVEGSPHYDDQMKLYADGKYKDSNFGASAARRAAVQKVFLSR